MLLYLHVELNTSGFLIQLLWPYAYILMLIPIPRIEHRALHTQSVYSAIKLYRQLIIFLKIIIYQSLVYPGIKK